MIQLVKTLGGSRWLRFYDDKVDQDIRRIRIVRIYNDIWLVKSLKGYRWLDFIHLYMYKF